MARSSEARFGTVLLTDLETMAPELGRFAAGLGNFRYAVMGALRQCLDAAVRWRLIGENPAKLAGRNPQPPAVEVTPFTVAEVDAIDMELGKRYGPLVVFAAETGLRPSEWIALERRDVDREHGVVLVERSFASGLAKSHGKTARSRRRVPLTDRALAAIDRLPPRLGTRLLFPSPGGGYHDLHNWRYRDWYPALAAAGLEKRGPYALRHTYATWALRAGLGTFELARYMGTSVAMIDATYGHLAAGSQERARTLLGAYAAESIAKAKAEAEAESGRLGH